MECFSNSLSDLSKSKNVYYILGDFNINIHPDSRTTHANDYINLLLNHGAFPLITKPTRVTENSAIIIDHIINNNTINVLNPGVIYSDLIDYYPIFCSVKRFLRKCPKYITGTNHHSAQNAFAKLNKMCLKFILSTSKIFI